MTVAAVPALGWGEVAIRIAVAAALGAAVGFERELREREAGLRTHLLVSVGSAIFTIVSAYGFREFLTSGNDLVRIDPTRIAAQIVTGIGFIGAGAIIREGMSVRGLTTAATLWVVAAIGLAAGAGYYAAAVIGTAIVIFSLGPLRLLAYRAIERLRPEERRLMLELQAGQSLTPLLQLLEAQGVHVESLELDEERDRRDRPARHSTSRSQPLVPLLSDLDYVLAVRWRR